MINNLQEEFIEATKSNVSEKSRDWWRSFFSDINIAEEKNGCNVASFTLDQMCDFLGGGSYAVSSIAIRKSRLGNYINFLVSKGVVSQLQRARMPSPSAEKIAEVCGRGQCLFSSFKEYSECIRIGIEYSPETQTLRDLVVFYLMWLRFTRDEIVDLKVTDYDRLHKTIAGKPIHEDEIINTFNLYLATTGFVREDGKKYNYVNSEYFVRGYLRSGKVTVHYVSGLLRVGANGMADKVSEKLSEDAASKVIKMTARTIYHSSLFEEIYKYEMGKGIDDPDNTEMFEALCSCEKKYREVSATSWFVVTKDYKVWKRAYHS